jgi:cell division septal protein FtsQ
MSLFSNNNPNKRIKKGGARRTHNLLEVSVRPDGERKESILPQIVAVLKVLLVVSTFGGVCFGGKTAMRRLVWENPMYALADIRVSTDGLLTRKQVLEIAEVEEGQNIFSVDLKKARKNLDQLPQVDRVEVRRLVPDRVDIKIIERQPVAWVAPQADSPLAVGEQAMLVDSRGYVMRSRKIQPEHAALPVIIGISMEDVAAGQKLPSAEALAAIDLIRLCADDLRWQPRVVDVSKGYCLIVTDHRKAKITFAFDGIEDQLARLKHLIELVEPTHREFQSVNLMLEKSVPVVFAAPPLSNPADIKKNTGKTIQSKGNISNSTAGAISQNIQPPAVIVVAPAVATASGNAAAANTSNDNGPSGGVVSRSASIPAQRAPESVSETRQQAHKNVREPSDNHSAALQSASKTPMGSSAPAASIAVKAPLKSDKSPSKTDKPEKAHPAAAGERVKVESVEKAVEKKGNGSKPPASGNSLQNSLSPSEALRKLFNPHG